MKLCWIVEGVGKHARVATAAVASSKITTRNQMAGGTSLVTRSLLGSNRGNEHPGVHDDNQAPGGLSLEKKEGFSNEGRKWKLVGF